MMAASTYRRRAGVSPGCVVAMAVALVTSGQMGCGADVERMAVAVQRSGDACGATVQGSVRPMNAYMVELRAFSPDAGEAAQAGDGCVACNAGTREDCALLQRQCLCDSARPTTSSALTEALSGLRFRELQGDVALCLRVIALEDESVDAVAPTSCECHNAWIKRMPPPPQLPGQLLSYGRACASHAAATVVESGTLTLELNCLDDHDDDNGPDGPLGPPPPSAYQQCMSDPLF